MSHLPSAEVQAHYDLQAVLHLDDLWSEAYNQDEPEIMAEILADDWVAFYPGGEVIDKMYCITAMSSSPPTALLSFVRDTWSLLGHTAITRVSLFAGEEYVQSQFRVFAKRGDLWRAVSLQVVV